jgi:hypothetical protein
MSFLIALIAKYIIIAKFVALRLAGWFGAIFFWDHGRRTRKKRFYAAAIVFWTVVSLFSLLFIPGVRYFVGALLSQ